MDEKIKTWLFDILQSIEEIESYYVGKPKIFADYKKDIKTKRATERNIEIIGEASARILRRDPDFLLENIHQIIGTRNRVAHRYDTISDDVIWGIVINHLPKLKKEVTELLNKKGG